MPNTSNQPLPASSIYLAADEGRKYNMGAIQAVFKADEEETQSRYSVSEWWLDPNTEGPGAHLHENNDEIFYVLEGEASLLVGENWMTAVKGGFFMIAKNTIHDFANRSAERMGLLSFYIPGGFERNMPSIVKWFADNR